MTQPRNDHIRARREFESKVFLLFALRLVYRHYVRSPMINNWIAKLNREVQAECRGRRRRIRGPLIRFGKKIIEAVFRNKNALVDELREGYTSDANASINNRARMYGSNQYGYAERRAREALEKAVNAFGRNRPSAKMPFMSDKPGPWNEGYEFEESVLNDPEQAENHTESEVSSWATPFPRPSEEDVNAMLANACDDNGYSEDKFDNPPPAEQPSAPTIHTEQAYFPGFEPTTITTHKSARIRSKWAHLRANPENGHD